MQKGREREERQEGRDRKEETGSGSRRGRSYLSSTLPLTSAREMKSFLPSWPLYSRMPVVSEARNSMAMRTVW